MTRAGGTIQGLSGPQRLARLRAALAASERPLLGWGAIQAQLAAWRIVTREGALPSVRTLKRWRQQRRFPVAIEPLGRAWTTTYAVLAWLFGPDFAGLSPRRRDGTLTRPAHARRRRSRVPEAPQPAPPFAAAPGRPRAPKPLASRGPTPRGPAPAGCRSCARWPVLPAGRRCSTCGRAGAG